MPEILKGWKTIAFGLVLAVAPSAISYLANIDWSQYVDVNVASFITGTLVVLLRVLTTTPVGKK